MASPACTGGAQLLLPVLLFACLHLSAVKSLDVSSAAPAPAAAAVASPFSFRFDFTGKSSYRRQDLRFEGDADRKSNPIDLTCGSEVEKPAQCTGRVSYAHPVPFYDNTTADGEVASFRTSFTFAILTKNNTPKYKGDGMAFFLAYYPSELPLNSAGGNLGLMSSNGDDGKRLPALGTQQFVAVEFGTFKNNPWDPSDDHIGIDINSVASVAYKILPNFSLNGTMTATVTFDNTTLMLVADLQFGHDATSGSAQVSKQLPLPLSTLLPAQVAVGFSAATGSNSALHQLMSWSFNSSLAPPRKVRNMKPAIVGGSVGGAVALVIVGWCIVSCFKWTRSTGHDFVVPTGGIRLFDYRVLAAATDNFSEKNVLGRGAFGVVYKGTLSNGSSTGVHSRELDGLSPKESAGRIEVAVKKILKEVRSGNLDFFTEMNIISEAKHKNLVKLKGWCRKENSRSLLDFMCWCCRTKENDELFLVYELVPNKNLQYHLYETNQGIPWTTRYQIVEDIGCALVYLHHECAPNILHRDIKPGNILLDNNFNAKLADFGLSRIGNQDNAALVTYGIGTEGYIAPECRRTGKIEFAPSSDVYSFGIVLLDIVCTGKPRDQVWELYKRGKVMEATDGKLHGSDDLDRRQMKSVAVLGLWCSLADSAKRPTVREAMEVLERDDLLPDLVELFNASSAPPSSQQDTCTSSSDHKALDIEMTAAIPDERHA